jgi:hypothetical protein
VSIQGFQHSIGGSPVVEKTQDGKIVGDKNKKLKRVDVRFSFKGIANIREHSTVLSGSVQWEMIYRIVVRLVPELKSLNFTVTNTATRFYLMKSVRIEGIYRERTKGSGYTLELFESETTGFSKLLIRFSDGVVASVFSNGTVVAQGKDVKGIEKRVKDVLNTYKNPYKVGGNAAKKVPVAARKNLAKKRANITENRYERASNWSNVRSGFYVRPGPNKVPRFYAVPANPALVRKKVMRAYANVGVNVPNAVRNILGISGTSVKPKVVIAKKTAGNWNASPPTGMYIRPGPGGLPKFYKIPKLVKQGKKTVLESYKKAGVKIPNRVRQIFSISPSSAANKTPTNPKLNVTNKGVFRIDGLACSRYKLEDLRRIAGRMGVPVLKRSKADLCRDVKKRLNTSSPAKSPAVNFVKNGVKYYIFPEEKRIKRNRHTKTMNSFKIQELKNIISAVNNSTNVSGKLSKKQLIDLLIERKRMMNVIANLNFSALSSDSSPSSKGSSLSNGSPSSSASPKRTGTNIARNILGPGFTNAELKNFLNKYMKSPGSLNRIVKEFKAPKLKKLANAKVEVL